MDNVNKTLYIPLYGKAYVTKKNIILNDPIACEIWGKEGFDIKGKSKSKWLAYYMAMRARVFDLWVEEQVKLHPNAIVLHVGCGLDNRHGRVNCNDVEWYDIDFEEVIKVRKRYYEETTNYHMIPSDIRNQSFLNAFEKQQDVIVVMEGISMYLENTDLIAFFSNMSQYFNNVHLLMDAYSEFAAKMSKYKNPINDVGVYNVYGIDSPEMLNVSKFVFTKQHELTPNVLIEQLSGLEKMVFSKLYAGKFASKLYKLYEYEKKGEN